MMGNRSGIGRATGVSATLCCVLLVLFTASCDLNNLLDVDAASRIPASELDNPASATLLLNGAIGDFECAFGSYVVLSGMVGEELMDATQTADRWPYERRATKSNDARYATFGCTALGVYTPMSTARWAAENVLRKLEGWTDAEVPDRQRMIATAAAYSGYAHVILAEGFCSGVLLDPSLTPTGEVDRTAMNARAIERFNQAIETLTPLPESAAKTDLLNMARVGLARALLNNGDGAAAATAAAQVTTDYVKHASASTSFTRRENRVVRDNNTSNSTSIGPEYRNFQHMGLPDPRVPVTDLDRTATDGTPLFVQDKYEALNTPLPLATWEEAQLIIAEASGGLAAVNIINALHSRAGLPPFVSVSESEIQAHIIQERRAELFLEGHHLGDAIRYSIQLSPAVGTPYPKGGAYENQVCLPLPDIERLNNPLISSM